MALYINSNISSMISQRYLTKNTEGLSTSLERLSSGSKINHAGDDAAGLALSESLQSQVRGTDQAIDNIQDGINMLQIAEGGLEIITDNLQRIRELCIQAANEIYDENSKQAILNEIDQRLKIINTTAATTNFNGKKLLDGSVASLFVQIGPNGDVASTDPNVPTKYLNAIDVAPALTEATSDALGIDMQITALGKAQAAGGNFIDATTWTTQNVRDYINSLDEALTKIANDRSVMGAFMNAMDSAAANLTSTNISLESARSSIQDSDVATLSADMVRYQILQQTSTSVLAQANQMPALALTLLGS